jgi:hypothetical protein
VRSYRPVPYTELRERIDPRTLGCLLLQGKGKEGDLNAFAKFVRDELSPEAEKRSLPSIGPYSIDNQEAVDRLVKSCATEVLSWLEPLLENASMLRMRLAMSDFLLLRLTRALLRFRPDDGARVWSAAIQAKGHAIDDFLMKVWSDHWNSPSLLNICSVC